jgi:hypothetical protein
MRSNNASFRFGLLCSCPGGRLGYLMLILNSFLWCFRSAVFFNPDAAKPISRLLDDVRLPVKVDWRKLVYNFFGQSEAIRPLNVLCRAVSERIWHSEEADVAHVPGPKAAHSHLQARDHVEGELAGDAAERGGQERRNGMDGAWARKRCGGGRCHHRDAADWQEQLRTG